MAKQITSKKHQRLTIKELRSYGEGFKDFSDDELSESIEALEKLSVIMFELYQQHKAKQNEQQITSSEICERKAA